MDVYEFAEQYYKKQAKAKADQKNMLGDQYDMYSQEREISGHITDQMLSEVDSVETWRSLLLISTKSGMCLQDLDNRKSSYSLPIQSVDF